MNSLTFTDVVLTQFVSLISQQWRGFSSFTVKLTPLRLSLDKRLKREESVSLTVICIFYSFLIINQIHKLLTKGVTQASVMSVNSRAPA